MSLFKTDRAGDATLETVRTLSKHIRGRTRECDPAVMDVLLHVPLSTTMRRAEAAQKQLKQCVL